MAGAVASCFTASAYALPTDPTVVNGSASINQVGNVLNVTNSNGAIINWNTFSIGASEITRFIQPSVSSSVLNRVLSSDPSVILGTLTSNGRVFLINPNGILVGAGARIDVGGFVASTLNLSNANFLANKLQFDAPPGAGSVVNQGSITTPSGGTVYLVAPNVSNEGLITTPQGETILAAGQKVALLDTGTPGVSVEIVGSEGNATNLGQIVADAGRIGIAGVIVRNSGTLNASSAVNEGGRIFLKVAKDITLDAGSRTEANGSKGGSVTAQAAGGTLLASGVIEAKGSADKGGEIQLLGNQVGLIDNAVVDASGRTGGGSVLIGGDRHGDNPAVQNAWRTYFGPAAIVRADAVQSGDGGKVIVWSDDVTRFYGSISARGSANGGNGGFAEVSGKEFLIYRGITDMSAAAGGFGTLLLDPRDITIQASGANDGELTVGVPSGQLADQILFADANSTTDFTLTNTTVSTSAANVVLQAQRDISINAAVTLLNDVDFIAQAGRNINVNATLTSNGMTANKGNIHLEADSPHAGTPYFDGVGEININAPINACGGAAGGCAGGNITLIGGGNSSPKGGFNLNANVQAGGGGINVALSNSAALSFYIGAGGNTQLSSNDSGFLLSTGPLVLGSATTAGSDGAGNGAIPLLVNSLSQLNATPMTLSTNSGTSFELAAGSGGITLDRNLTTYQLTLINTTGAFTLGAALNTSNHNLVINASSVNLTGGSITTGTGTFGCSGTGCPAGSTSVDQWIGGNGDWLTATNWSLGHAPTATQVALIDQSGGLYTITLGSTSAPANESVGLLVNKEILDLVGNGTTKTSLDISSLLTYNNSPASNSSASFNIGTISLTNATLGGTGLLENQGTLNITDSTVTAAVNQTAGTLNALSGTNLISGGLTLAVGTTLSITSGTTTVTALDLNGGSVTGGGNLTVTTDFNQAAGAAIGMSGALDVTQASGNLSVNGGISAASVLLRASAGDIVLNQTVTGTGGGDSVVLVASGNFVNTAGAAPINSGTGRYLIYSTDPASNTFGGFVSPGNLFGRTYAANPPATIGSGFGNRFIYSVTPTLTLTADNQSKTYGDLNPAFTYSVSGLIAGDSIGSAISSGPSYAVGGSTSTSGQLTASTLHNITPSAATASSLGYSLSYANGVLTVNQKALTVTAGGQSKPYDGTATATVTLGDNRLSGDALTLAYGGAAFNDKNVGTAKPVSVSAINVTGTDAGNYTFNTAASTTANITPAALTLSGITAANKVYDATTAATVSTAGAVYSGLLGGDAVTVSATGTFADKNVANGKTVTLASSYSGADVGNYTITNQASTTADITPASLTVSGITASNKVYDATQTAAVSTGAASYTGLYAGDAVTVSATGLFSDKNVANGKTVTLTSSYAGADKNNYTITDQTTTTANITPTALTITANAAGKPYDGLAYSGGNGVAYSGFVNSETSAVLGGALTYGGSAQGAINAGGYLITPGGLTSGNYTISYFSGGLTVNPAALSVTANNTAKNYGQTISFSGTEFGASGLQNGETIGTVTLASAGTAATANVAGSPYVIAPSAATGGTFNAGNYTITYNNGALTVSPAALTVTASNASKTYGQTPTLTAFTSSGLQNGETIGSVTETSAGAAANAGVAGSPYAITPSAATGGTFNAGNYTIAYNNGALTVTPAALSVTANAASKTYDGLAYSGGNGVAYGGFVNGETSAVLGGALTYGGNAQVAINTGGYLITPSGLTSGNYTISYFNGALTVTPATLTYTANAASRLYGGADPAFSGTVTGFVLTDTLGTATTGSASFNTSALSTSNIGSYAINGSGLSANNGNYIFVQAAGNATAFTINPAPLTVIASNASKTYGQTPTLTAFTSSGLQNGETIGGVTETSAGAAANAGVAGSPYSITPGAATGGTFNAGNYTITYNNGALTVNPAVLNLSGTRPYDATTTFAASEFGASGTISGVNGETLTLTGAGSVAGPNIGPHALDATGLTLVDDTGLASNYTLSGGTQTGTITQLAASSTNTEQLVNTQVNPQPDNAVLKNIVLIQVNPVSSGGLLTTSVYLEVPGGLTMPLIPTLNTDPGVYININTGEKMLIQAGVIPEPGIYLNQDTNVVLVVELDKKTGQPIILTGLASESGITAGARVVRTELNTCSW